jgi:acetyl-CoA carboxylase carboxyltransferase component
MKRIIAAALVTTAAFAGAASAMGAATSGQELTILKYAPDANVSALSGSEVVHIINEINANKDLTKSEQNAQVQSLVRAFSAN